MEDILNFKKVNENSWHAELNEMEFDIEKRSNEYELTVHGGHVHEHYTCRSLEDAQEKAKKFTVW